APAGRSRRRTSAWHALLQITTSQKKTLRGPKNQRKLPQRIYSSSLSVNEGPGSKLLLAKKAAGQPAAFSCSLQHHCTVAVRLVFVDGVLKPAGTPTVTVVVPAATPWNVD